jgi:hypothetical protein
VGLRWLVVLVLLAMATEKFYTGHRDHFKMPAMLYYSSALVELMLAGLLACARQRIVGVALIMIALMGIAVEMFGSGGSCGCLGARIVLTSRQHMLVASAFGLVGLLVLKDANMTARNRPERSLVVPRN